MKKYYNGKQKVFRFKAFDMVEDYWVIYEPVSESVAEKLSKEFNDEMLYDNIGYEEISECVN